MKYLYLLAAFIIINSTSSFAQNNFKSTNSVISSDTLKNQSSENTYIHFLAGVTVNSFSSSVSSSYYELGKSKSSNSTMPGFNIGIDIPFDPSNRWIFRTEASVNSNKDNFSYQYASGSDTQITEALNLKELILDITPQVMLNVVNTTTLKIYLASGITINLRSYSSKKFTNTTTYTVSGTTSTGDATIPELKSVTFCVPAKAGLVFAKCVDVYATYNAKTSLNNDSDLSINETLFTVGINYIFGK